MHNRGTTSGWRDGLINPFFRARFVKKQNSLRDGVKVVHDVMASSTLFWGCDLWNIKIIGVMAWKWCMAWWRDRPLYRALCMFFLLIDNISEHCFSTRSLRLVYFLHTSEFRLLCKFLPLIDNTPEHCHIY